ncbi:MAG: hypothetical protein NTV86_20220 [Planctomycetota bacterium]|nr:hypothetical protein [Planctomycetota bacterium]
MDLWILSFSDCMVNLMAFFVMMLTFSSTSHSSKSRVEGVYPTKEGDSAMAMPGTKGGSLAAGANVLQETTETGSEFATDSDPVPTHNPKESPDSKVGAEAFRSRHDVAIPCGRLFFGRGAVLKPGSGECLSLLAGYLEKVPTHNVVVSAGPAPGDLDRASAVVEYLAAKGLQGERFSIGAGPAQRDPKDRPLVIVTVLPRSLFP